MYALDLSKRDGRSHYRDCTPRKVLQDRNNPFVYLFPTRARVTYKKANHQRFGKMWRVQGPYEAKGLKGCVINRCFDAPEKNCLARRVGDDY